MAAPILERAVFIRSGKLSQNSETNKTKTNVFFQRSGIQMRRVPILPPKVWTAVTELRHRASPLPSPPACSTLTVLRGFHLFFPKYVFLFGYLFFPMESTSPVIFEKMTTVRPTASKSAETMKWFCVPLISTAVNPGTFRTVWDSLPNVSPWLRQALWQYITRY